MPPAWCEELAQLRSHAEPAPRDAIQPIVEADLGGSVDASFVRFDWAPIASASIAQVYTAELTDGTPVIVKVQRPGLEETIALDSAAIMQLAGLIEQHTTLGLSMRPRELAAEFLENVREELNFLMEAENVVAVGTALTGVEGVRVPGVYPALSTRRVLTEERVRGTSIAHTAELEALGIDVGEVSGRLVDAFVKQIFDVGVFHSDPHPGNILVEDDGTIVLIDFGAVGRLGPSQRTLVLQMLAAASAGDAAGLREALAAMTVFDDRANLRQLDLDLEDMLARHMRSGGGITIDAFQDLASMTARFDIHLPRWFGTLSRTLVTLEGTLRAIDPTFSLVDAARDRARQVAFRVARPASLRSALEQEAMAQLPRIQRLPQRLDELLGQAVNGRLGARLSLFSHEADERLVRRLMDRFVLALLAAALGIGSVLLLNVSTGPRLSDSVTLNEVLGYIGLACSTVLVLRVIAGVIRDGLT
jgi:ubiquinone biosynthesis protein